MPVTVPSDIFNPIIDAIGTDQGYKDQQAYNANIDFDTRVQRAALPIKRMLTPEGKINKAAISNLRPFDDPYQMWEDLNANMPKGRGVDPQVFQEKYQMGKQMHDMSLANQLNVMRQHGMSDRIIKKQFKDNPGMLQYMYENGIMQPKMQGTGWGATAASAGIYGAARGSMGLQQMMKTPKPTSAQLAALKAEGYKWQGKGKNIGIRKMTPMDIYKMNKDTMPKVPKKPNKKKFVFKKGKNAGKHNAKSYAKAMKDWKAAKTARTKEYGVRLKDARAVAKARDARELSKMGRAALSKGAKGAGGRYATNWVLGSVGKTVGARVGMGIGARALGLLGGPLGIAATGLSLLPLLYSGIKSSSGSRWE